MRKCNLEKAPLSNYLNFLKNGKEPYASIWRTFVGEITSYSKGIDLSKGAIYCLDSKSIKKKLGRTITKRELLKRLKTSNINKTIAAGLLASNLEEGDVALSNNEDFFRNLSGGRTKYHVKVDEENISKIQSGFK